ncbi:hypothetical protein WA026_020254 [Henosepilachna vigintioctopunctata]|uniref:Uncharacterized protein n=1 Tax=Henosepilachna vigintioctopunctata TaxID=420089 RepID=A0AAW1TXK9_9CUCU
MSEDVCRIILNFEQFSLECSKEYLTVDGRKYCGNQNGRSVFIDIQSAQIDILYTKIDSSSIGSRFKINGIQDTTNCLDPPPQLTLKKTL